MKAGISIRVIYMPLRVDQPGDGVGAEAIDGSGNAWPRHRKPGVNEELALRAAQERDVSPGALRDADAPTKRVDLELGPLRRQDHSRNDARVWTHGRLHVLVICARRDVGIGGRWMSACPTVDTTRFDVGLHAAVLAASSGRRS